LEKQKLYELIDKYVAGQATKEEADSLSRYYNSFQETNMWNKTELGEAHEVETKILDIIQEKIKTNNREEIVKDVEEKDGYEVKEISVVEQKRTLFIFKRIALAACVIGLIVFVAFNFLRGNQSNEFVDKKLANTSYKKEIEPGSDKAILQLADGSTIALEHVRDGVIALQGNSKIIKLGNKLNYDILSNRNKTVYNSLTTPRGGKFQIALPDGSQVWLNAGSSIHFPTAFVNKERRVEITGEAYFEVAKNKAMPFIVGVSGAEVQVLGTHFNVMAYFDEPSVKTTLLEGAVRFVKGAAVSTLSPGTQSQLSKTGQIKVIKGVNLDEELAWKNGNFDFQGKDIGTVMRQLARWYELDVFYDARIDDLFYAKIPRSTELRNVLKLLELTGKVHFQIDGRRITVKR
jgi:hypothetical protein